MTRVFPSAASVYPKKSPWRLGTSERGQRNIIIVRRAFGQPARLASHGGRFFFRLGHARTTTTNRRNIISLKRLLFLYTCTNRFK